MAICEGKPWLKNYAPGVRPHLNYPEIPLYSLLDEAVKNFPDLPAMIYADTTLTYGELGQQVDCISGALQILGVAKGDRVAIMLPNCHQLAVSFYSVLKAGGIVVHSNPMHMERELEYQLNNAGAETIIMRDSYYPRLKSIRDKTSIKNIIVTRFEPQAIPAGEPVISYEELLSTAYANSPVEIDPLNDIAVIQYTGGTTGQSKGAMLTHYNLVANTLQVRAAINFDYEPGREKILVALPNFHVYGMTAGMNLTLSIAGTQILVPRFDINATLQAINNYRPTLFPGAPAIFASIIRSQALKDIDFSSIKACLCISAPIAAEVAQKFRELTGVKLVEGYGLTEASPVVTVNQLNSECKAGSTGLPVPDTDCCIVNLDTGDKEIPTGEIGELIVRGPQVMKGYWEQPEENAYALRKGWLYTGDVARIDEDGCVFVVGRKKDMIASIGFNVYPRDVEEVLYEHPKITEAVVLGVNDQYHIESVKAFIVLKQGECATEEEIQQFCRERLDSFKVPRVVEFRDSLPKTIVGKILRRVLMEEERKKNGPS